MALNSQIPAELLEEILQFLPSSILLNFRRVCKDWNQLISSQRFIQQHLHKSTSGRNGTLIITLSSLGISVYDDPIEKKIRRRIPFPPGLSPYNTTIIGSCNGLVCLVRGRNKDIALFNPSTGTSRVHRFNRFDRFFLSDCFWFGQHPSTGEYLIVTVETIPKSMILVYQIPDALVHTQSQHIPFPRSSPFFFATPIGPILLHGALHWYGYRAIVAYDIEKNRVREIVSPFESWSRVRLGTVDGCLFAISYVRGEGCELWVMREYGVEESWTKYWKTEEGFKVRRDLSPLGILADGDLLLKVDYRHVVKYNLNGKKDGDIIVYRDYFKEDCESESAVLCFDSLVSPPPLISGK